MNYGSHPFILVTFRHNFTVKGTGYICIMLLSWIMCPRIGISTGFLWTK